MKRQATEWKKIFSNHISNKRQVSRIYKEPKINSRKANNTNKQKVLKQEL